VAKGYNPAMGARPLRRVIQEEIEDRIADFYLDHADVKNLVAKIEDGKIVLAADTDTAQPAAAEPTTDKK
jgi:ATP-dependent Clp protease ATP-binding subunit ClpE